MKRLKIVLAALLLSFALSAKEYHIAKTGNDNSKGTSESAFLTIQAAANIAQPGDVITVHKGVYRERVNPPRGGTSDDKRIVYQAAEEERVIIKGSEIMKGWKKIKNDIWTVSLPNSFFGDFNPYQDTIFGDWFISNGRTHHTGAVYLNGHWLSEAVNKAEVFNHASGNPLWFGAVDDANTTLWAQFKGVNPNTQEVEINVRRTVFYPEKTGVNYITVKGFSLTHAATPWAPPTAEQIALIGTHWSKGWIIENNEISYSVCSGISLGKYGDEFDNTSANTAAGYVATIERALKNGWKKKNIGSHTVRNNNVHHCEQAGIVGSLGGIFSTITGNEVHDIHVRRLFSGMEMSGIKIHAPIDMLISNNYVYHCWRGLWLDWMAQGTRVTANLFHDNETANDLFIEVSHGPFLIDNNLFLSPNSIFDISQGGAYVHNLIAGRIMPQDNSRIVPYHEAHSTKIIELKGISLGDERYYNNIFVSPEGNLLFPERVQLNKDANYFGLSYFDSITLPLQLSGNVFLKEAKPCEQEQNPIVETNFNPNIHLTQKKDGVYLGMLVDIVWLNKQRQLVTTDVLGRAENPKLPFVNPDDTPYILDTDYSGMKRDTDNPAPGPFEFPDKKKISIKVWPMK